MQVAIMLFARLTALDAIGPYEVLQTVPEHDVVFVGEHRGEVRADTGILGLTVDKTFAEVQSPDIVVVRADPAHVTCSTGEPTSTGCARSTRAPDSPRRSARVRSSSPRRGCSTGSPPPPTGAPWNTWRSSVPCR